MTSGIKCQPELMFYISDSHLGKSRVELVKQECFPMSCISMKVLSSGSGKGTISLETGVRME